MLIFKIIKASFTMKRIHFAGLLILATIVFACKKGTNPLVPHSNTDDDDFSFQIKGLRDTSLERSDYVSYLVFVEKLTGEGEYVSLTVDSLPKGMTVSFVPVSADTASFNTTMRIETERVVEGNYAINVKAATSTAGIANNNINIAVKPYSNHAVGIAGEYSEKGACQQVGNVQNDVRIEAAAEKNKIIIRGLLTGVMSNKITATVNPTNKTINIPSQIVNSATYEGDGTFDDDKVVINYTVKAASSINESCSSTLTRK